MSWRNNVGPMWSPNCCWTMSPTSVEMLEHSALCNRDYVMIFDVAIGHLCFQRLLGSGWSKIYVFIA